MNGMERVQLMRVGDLVFHEWVFNTSDAVVFWYHVLHLLIILVDCRIDS